MNINGPNVVKGKSGDTLEHCLKGLMPIVRISDTKFLLGTSIKSVQVRSDKLMVMAGGGGVSLAEYWRTIAVSETIKLNKLVQS